MPDQHTSDPEPTDYQPSPAHLRSFDLTGKVFTRWTVIERAEPSKDRRVRWLCRCTCGTIAIVLGGNLRRGLSKSCGCLQDCGDLTGRSFGQLTVEGPADKPEHRERGKHWKCRCLCGQLVVADTNRLFGGGCKSCGCLKKKAPGVAAENSIFLCYRRAAMQRRIPFRLTREQCAVFFRSPCHYCGVVGNNTRQQFVNNGGMRYNGIDRLDSSKGYETGNVVAACGTCNIAKRRMGYQEFLNWITRVYRNRVATKRTPRIAAAATTGTFPF